MMTRLRHPPRAEGEDVRQRPAGRIGADSRSLAPHEVVVLVMAAGVNYNGIWAALGKPVSVFPCIHGTRSTFRVRTPPEWSGEVGSDVSRWQVGRRGCSSTAT